MKLYIILIILLIIVFSGCVSEKKDTRMHVLVEDNQTNNIYRLYVYSETNDYYYGYLAGALHESTYLSKTRFKYLGSW